MGFFSKITQPNNKQDARFGNRHVADSARGGRPAEAVAFTGEGNMAVFKKKNKRFVEPLDPLLSAQGVSEEDWTKIIEGLRSSWRALSKKKFKAMIEELNEVYFTPRGLIAVYAEYGPKGGQKAMTVYTKDNYNALPSSKSAQKVTP